MSTRSRRYPWWGPRKGKNAYYGCADVVSFYEYEREERAIASAPYLTLLPYEAYVQALRRALARGTDAPPRTGAFDPP